MPEYVGTFNQIAALGIIALQVIILLLLINLIFFRSHTNAILVFFKDYTFYLGFLISLGAVAISLFYSNVIGFPPCELCWIQRIFLYPQLIVYSMLLYKKEKSMSLVDMSMILAIINTLAALFHVYVENGGGEGTLPCANPATNQVSCAIRYVYEFGYITIPVMSLTLSVFILLLTINYKYMSKK
jgi:disulfide bond formation protein DsbB